MAATNDTIKGLLAEFRGYAHGIYAKNKCIALFPRIILKVKILMINAFTMAAGTAKAS